MTSIFSIFGEWSGNVRSTPTPDESLRTVNVSRTPAPWRLMTIPSKTWTRRRWPSITWKCTRTVSPALNCGMPSRSCLRSRMSIGVLIRGTATEGRRTMLAKADPLRRPVDRENRPDQVAARHRSPLAAVARLGAVVAHHEVRPLRDVPTAVRLRIALVLGHVRLVEGLAVDADSPSALGDRVSGQADDPLDEGAAGAAFLERERRGVEDDDVATMRVAEMIDEPVCEHAVRVVGEAARLRLCAVERRLHGRRGDAVGVHDPRLDREDCADGHHDRDDPVYDRGPRRRQPGRE